MGGAHFLRRDAVARSLLLACLLAARPSAFALNPALDVSQYAHASWKVRDGFCRGTILSIAQTPDGYLWLGTEFGLVRFDGVRPVPWQPPRGQDLPSDYIRSLLAARDGRLWIGAIRGLASWKDGKLTRYPELAGPSIWDLAEDRAGTVWASAQAGPAAATGKLCAFLKGSAQCYGEDGSFGLNAGPIIGDRAGNLWVGSMTGLWRWKPGPPKLYPMPDTVQDLMDGENGALMIAMHGGIRRFVDGKIDSYPLPVSGQRFSARTFLRDRDGGLWIGTTDRGLVHVHHGRTDVFDRSDGLSSDFIEKIFEDREGNIWVATLDGLDRFRDLAVPTISVKQGLSNAAVQSVLAARDGSMWLGTLDSLNRWKDGRVTVYRKRSARTIASGGKAEPELHDPGAVREISASGLPDDAIESLFQDSRNRIWVATRGGLAFLEDDRFTAVDSVPGGVHSIAEDRAGDLWISQHENLFRLRNGSVVERIPLATLGHKDWVRSIVADPSKSGVWLAFRDGGVGYLEGGAIRGWYTIAQGLGAGHVWDLQLDREGAFWAATEGGLSRLKNGRVATLSSRNGLPCDDVHWAMEDDAGFFWVYMACGLARLPRSDVDAWVAAANSDPLKRIQATIFGGSDGVRGHTTTTGYSPSVARSADGKLWFLPWDGVSVLDPRHLPSNGLFPPVHIEQVTANRQPYGADTEKGQLSLPARIRDLEIDYTALSLVAPEKVFFRYKLENWDSDWQDAGNRRQAFYTNLSPGKYRFRVTACNNSGVWNEAGVALGFAIAPAYYQATWFRLSCAAGFLALLAALYQLRLRQVARQFNLRLEARVNERTRIARDFHDTLLQSFQAVLMKFHAVTYLLPDRPAEAREKLETVIEQARLAVTEGRDAVHGLRSSTEVTNDLARAIGKLAKDLAAAQTGSNCPECRVHVEGKSRDLTPLVRDEVHRIASEALRNAFRHAHAATIDVQIHFERRHFRLLVRDDGKGIDPKVLDGGGCAGHYGLPGMNERAKLVGGKLTLRSKLDAGTEAELTVPGAVAYIKFPSSRRAMFFRKRDLTKSSSR